MNELVLKNETISSLEVAEMIDKAHNELLKDIRRYIEQLNEGNFPHVDFFRETTYVDAKGEERPCYNVTQKGCEFIANKLTGIKGAFFTAKYVNRFHDMESYISNQNKKPIQETLDSATRASEFIRGLYEDLGIDERYIGVAVSNIFTRAGVDIPMPIEMKENKLYDQTAIAEELGVLSAAGKPHSQAVGTIIGLLEIDDADKIRTPYTNHGHSGVVVQYTHNVVDMVQDWLSDNDYPSTINGNGKSFKVTYRR